MPTLLHDGEPKSPFFKWDVPEHYSTNAMRRKIMKKFVQTLQTVDYDWGGALRGLCGDTGWIPHLLLPVAPGARPGPQGDYEVLHGGDRGRDQGYGHYLLDYHEGGYILREQGVLPEVDRL